VPYVENFEEFKQRMGCEFVVTKRRYLFENGAQSAAGTHSEPPEDPATLVKLKHEYASVKLDRAIKRYNRMKESVAEQLSYHAAGVGPAPPEGFEQYLAGLADEIMALKAEVAELTHQLPAARRADEDREYQLQQQERSRDALTKLQALPSF
jgi:hypothetical protein